NKIMPSAWDQLEQMLTCPICLDKFKNPRLLPCQHTFCGDACMEGLIDYGRRQIKCPECRAEHRIPYQGVASLPSNVTLIRFLELHSRITGDEPEPVPTFMEKCSVCGEKIEGVTRCAHCDKKVCPECKEAHVDLLRREIGRVNSQIKRCATKMGEFKEALARHESKLEANYRSTRQEIERACRRLIDDLTAREQKLLVECDSYVDAERATLKKLAASLDSELATIESNVQLADEHLASTNSSGSSSSSGAGGGGPAVTGATWSDKELVDAKEIYVHTLEFVRLFEPELGDFTRKIRFVQVPDFETMRRKLAEVGELKLAEPASVLLAASLAELSHSSGNSGQVGAHLTTSASSYALSGGLMHSSSNSSMARGGGGAGAGGGGHDNAGSGFSAASTLGVPSNALMRSQSDHRLAVQFQQRLKGTAGAANADKDDLRSRYAPPPATGVGSLSSAAANKRVDDLTRDWPRPGDRDTDDFLATSGIHFRSAFMRKKGAGISDDYGAFDHLSNDHHHHYDAHHDSTYDSTPSRAHHVRFQAANNAAELDSASGAPVTSVFDSVEAERGPLSGVMRLADSPYLMRRLHQLEARAKVDAKSSVSSTEQSASRLTGNRSSRAATNIGTHAAYGHTRQMSEDEIEKQKKANKAAEAAVQLPVISPASVVSASNADDTTNAGSLGATDANAPTDRGSSTATPRAARRGVGRLRRQQSSTADETTTADVTESSVTDAPASTTTLTGKRRGLRSQLSRSDSLSGSNPTTDVAGTANDVAINDSPAARQRRRIQQQQQQQASSSSTTSHRARDNKNHSDLDIASPLTSTRTTLSEYARTNLTSDNADTQNDSPDVPATATTTTAVSKNVPLGSATRTTRATDQSASTSDTDDDTDDDDDDDTDDDHNSKTNQQQINTAIKTNDGAAGNNVREQRRHNLSRERDSDDDDDLSESSDGDDLASSATRATKATPFERTRQSPVTASSYTPSVASTKRTTDSGTHSRANQYSRRNYGTESSIEQESSGSARRTSRELLPSAVSLLLDRSAQIRRDSLEARQRTDSPVRASPLVGNDSTSNDTNSTTTNNNNSGNTKSSYSARGQRALSSYQRSQSQTTTDTDDQSANQSMDNDTSTVTSRALRRPSAYTSGSTSYLGSERSSAADRYASARSSARKDSNDYSGTSERDNSAYTSSHRLSISDDNSRSSTIKSSTPYQSRFLARSRTAASLATSSGSGASGSTGNSLRGSANGATGSQDSDDRVSNTSDTPTNDLSSTTSTSTSRPSYLSSRDRFMRDSTGSASQSGSSTPTSSAYQSARSMIGAGVNSAINTSTSRDNDDMSAFEAPSNSRVISSQQATSRIPGPQYNPPSRYMRAFSNFTGALLSSPSSMFSSSSSTSSSLRPSSTTGDRNHSSSRSSPPTTTSTTTAASQDWRHFGDAFETNDSIDDSKYILVDILVCASRRQSASTSSASNSSLVLRSRSTAAVFGAQSTALSSRTRDQSIYDSGQSDQSIGDDDPLAAATANEQVSRQTSLDYSDSLPDTAHVYLSKRRMTLKLGSRGSEPGNFTWPRGVAVTPTDNRIVVADSSNHRVQTFSATGRFISEFGTYGSAAAQFDCLAGVAINRQQQYIVSDRYNHRIQIFDQTGRFMRAFGSTGRSDAKFNLPWGVACDSHGLIYVCDKENHRVQVLDTSGNYVNQFGSCGTRAGQLQHPHYICVGNGRVVVTDTNNHRVQIFDTSSGRLITMFGTEGSANGQFKFPRGVAMDDQGYIIVGDSGNNRLQIFTNEGVFVKALGTWGSADGEFKGIEGVAVNSHYQVLVCDRENHRIQVF
ncbi:RING finger protein nhl-1, partial [Fragariocoptes setiger]